MTKITFKIALPIILAGIFAIIIFIAIGQESRGVGFYIVLILLSIYIFSFGFATGQNFSSPVKKILKKAIALSQGDLSSRVYIETKDELEDLAMVFNKIAENLQKSDLYGQEAEKSLGLKVRAKTQALEEVISALDRKVQNRGAELEKLMKESSTLQREVENKEEESVLLRKELELLKGKFAKYSSVQQKKI